MEDEKLKRVVILGGGPAGLTAAYELARHGLKPIIIEKLDKVGESHVPKITKVSILIWAGTASSLS